jgi:DNA-binding NarL/FixJ family response regulator
MAKEQLDIIEQLTRREIEVIDLVGQGRTNKEIARTLALSDRTVGCHRGNICRKLNIHSTGELVERAVLVRLLRIAEDNRK